MLQKFSITQNLDPGLRVCAFRVFAGPTLYVCVVGIPTVSVMTDDG